MSYIADDRVQQSYTFWRLQQVPQFNWELPPPPPPQTGLLHRMCYIS